ncbi:MAG: prepilin-type N-terminal cleavage/methylation domain-containing protein [Phycisphaeraceae bacterium]|nr:MAG: prepilin-type N-terminal cleavage/methylation domain-containing protein [Phycisphaeraceae bacterium]
MTVRLAPSRRLTARRGFTLVEVIITAVIAAFVLGALWSSMGQLTTARLIGQQRLLAHVRADAALNTIRQDVQCVLRSEDLFWTKLRIVDGLGTTINGPVDRDDLLLFSSRLRQTRENYGQGEGVEYETQYRIIEDSLGPVLWQRRDAPVDEYYDGGGVALPLIEDIIGFNVEAFDGYLWYNSWDSDELGLPFAIRITITAPVTGKPGDRPVVLRTVVSIDRVLPPYDADSEDDESSTGATGGAGTGGAGNQSGDGTGGGGGGGAGGGGTGGGGRPGGGFGGGGGGGRPGGGMGGGGGGRPGGGGGTGGGGRPGGGGGRGGAP